jgi:hypothetical protein
VFTNQPKDKYCLKVDFVEKIPKKINNRNLLEELSGRASASNMT